MEDIVYIDGNVVIEHGILYSKDIVVFAESEYKQGAAEVITPPNGIFTITEDYGSIFTLYYIRGECACCGENGDAYAFSTEHRFTYDNYKNNISLLVCFMDEVEIPECFKNLYYQQQYISVFGALEYFLFNTVMGQVCNNYDVYVKVLSSHLKCLEYSGEIRDILRGKHNLAQERVFIEQTKEVVYHNIKDVSDLFSAAFDISVDLGVLKSHVNTRNDIVHRFGHTKKNNEVNVTKENVLSLIAETDIIVNDVSEKIKELVDNAAQ